MSDSHASYSLSVTEALGLLPRGAAPHFLPSVSLVLTNGNRLKYTLTYKHIFSRNPSKPLLGHLHNFASLIRILHLLSDQFTRAWDSPKDSD